jgi:hypothetical protein
MPVPEAVAVALLDVLVDVEKVVDTVVVSGATDVVGADAVLLATAVLLETGEPDLGRYLTPVLGHVDVVPTISVRSYYQQVTLQERSGSSSILADMKRETETEGYDKRYGPGEVGTNAPVCTLPRTSNEYQIWFSAFELQPMVTSKPCKALSAA